MEQERLTALLLQYIDHQLAPDRMEEVRQWLAEDKEMQAHYHQLLNISNAMNSTPGEVPSERMEARYDQWLDTVQKGQHKKTMQLTLWYRIAASLLVLVGSVAILVSIRTLNNQRKELALIQQELEKTKQLVIADLTNRQSASQRMNAVYTAQEITHPDADIINLLIKTMNEDSNSNVRMVALESLSKYYLQPEVRNALITSMAYQKDPVVQIALIQLLVQMKEKVILKDLEAITQQPGLIKAVKDEAYKGIFKLT